MSREFDLPRSRGERGASAVEYGLLIAGIAAVIFAVILLFGGHVGGLFTHTCQVVSNSASAAAAGSCS